MKCDKCGVDLKPGTQFCENCGNKVVNDMPVELDDTMLIEDTVLIEDESKTNLVSTDDASKIGVFSDRYVIERVIGQTKSSEVFLVKNIKLSTPWIIKKIKKETDTGVLMPKEYEILKDLKHQYVPSIIDIEDDGTYMYLVEEFISGEDLNDIIKQRGSLSEVDAINYIIQLCDILSYLHNQKSAIIHRDIKPSNIIIDKDNKVNLIDFGIARTFKETATEDTVFMGTAGYASPEQHGFGQTDHRSDIYSVGMMLYFLLTGKNPSGSNFKMKPFTEIGCGAHSGLYSVILKCVNVEINNRYNDVSELKKALNAIKAEITIDADTLSLLKEQITGELRAEMGKGKKKKKRSLIPLFLLIIVALGGFGAFKLGLLDNVLEQFASSESEESSSNLDTSDLNNDSIEQNDNEVITDDKILVEEILVTSNIELKQNEVILIEASIFPANAENGDLIWKTSDENIVSVSQSGEILARGGGRAIITVATKDGSISKECTVNVSTPVLVESLSLDVETLELTEGDQHKLSATILPSDAENKTLKWQSSDVTVITVDDSGKIVAKSPGEVTISVITEEGNHKATCNVIVNEKDLLLTLNYDMVNRRNLQAGKEILLDSQYMYFNHNGKLIRSNHDGTERTIITNILSPESEIVAHDSEIFFTAQKEGVEYLYRIKSDGSEQANEIISLANIGSVTDSNYYDDKVSSVQKYLMKDLFIYRNKLYFTYSVRYRYSYSYYATAWKIISYDPNTETFETEFSKNTSDERRDDNFWAFYENTWYGNGNVYFTDTRDFGVFMKPIGADATLFSNSAPENMLTDDDSFYYIDLDDNGLYRSTLNGTLAKKLFDGVTYFTLTDFDEIIFAAGGNVYKVDKAVEKQPILIAEGIDKFIYAGEYLYYYSPDLSITQVNMGTGEKTVIVEATQ